MKQYTTCFRSISMVDGQHPNWPSDPFADWTKEGWQIHTAKIVANMTGHTIIGLLEREVPADSADATRT